MHSVGRVRFTLGFWAILIYKFSVWTHSIEFTQKQRVRLPEPRRKTRATLALCASIETAHGVGNVNLNAEIAHRPHGPLHCRALRVKRDVSKASRAATPRAGSHEKQ